MKLRSKRAQSSYLKGRRTPVVSVTYHRVPDRPKERSEKLNNKNLCFRASSNHFDTDDFISLHNPSILPGVVPERSLDIQEPEEFQNPTLQEDPTSHADNGFSIVKVEKLDEGYFPQETVYLQSSSTEVLREDSDCKDSNAHSDDSSVSDGEPRDPLETIGEPRDPLETKMFMSRQIQCELGMEKYRQFVVGGSQNVGEPVDTCCSTTEDFEPQPCLLTGDSLLEGLNFASPTAVFLEDQEVQCELGGETCKSSVRRNAYGRYVCIGGVDCPCKLPKPVETMRSKVIREVEQNETTRRQKSTNRLSQSDCSEDAAFQNRMLQNSERRNSHDEDESSLCEVDSSAQTTTYPLQEPVFIIVRNDPPQKLTFYNVVDFPQVRQKVASIIHKRSTPNILRRNSRTNTKRLI